MKRLCPRSRQPLRVVRHSKLRCPTCKTMYPRVPEPPDLLADRLYRRLRLIRWSAVFLCTVLAISSLSVLNRHQTDAGSYFWSNVEITIAYATALFTYIHWAMYLRMMQNTLWAGTWFAPVARRFSHRFIVAAALLGIGFSASLVIVVRDNLGQIAAVNLIAVTSALLIHFVVQLWNQHAEAIFDGIAASALFEGLKKALVRHRGNEDAPQPERVKETHPTRKARKGVTNDL